VLMEAVEKLCTGRRIRYQHWLFELQRSRGGAAQP
jgi:hypothetical protein